MAFSSGSAHVREARAIHVSPKKDETMSNQPHPRTAASAQSHDTVSPSVTDPMVRSIATSGSYTDSQHTTNVDLTGHQIENRAAVSQDKNLARAQRRPWVFNALFFLSGMLEMILALRFVLRLLGASQSSVTQFPSNLGHMLVATLNGIFHDQALGVHNVFELSPLIAILLLALLTWGLSVVDRVVVFTPSGRGSQR